VKARDGRQPSLPFLRGSSNPSGIFFSRGLISILIFYGFISFLPCRSLRLRSTLIVRWRVREANIMPQRATRFFSRRLDISKAAQYTRAASGESSSDERFDQRIQTAVLLGIRERLTIPSRERGRRLPPKSIPLESSEKRRFSIFERPFLSRESPPRIILPPNIPKDAITSRFKSDGIN